MKSFLTLTTRVINTQHILQIIIQPNKYILHMNQQSYDGIFFMASGAMDTTPHTIEICATKHTQDYKTMTRFLSQYASEMATVSS
jgi:hypothetical protein